MFIEIRTYRLKPGTGQEFVRVMQEESIPLLQRAGIRVVSSGMSLAAETPDLEEAYLMRAFDSVEQWRAQEEEFYASEAWHSGPRQAIVSRIESYHTVVVPATDLGLNPPPHGGDPSQGSTA